MGLLDRVRASGAHTELQSFLDDAGFLALRTPSPPHIPNTPISQDCLYTTFTASLQAGRIYAASVVASRSSGASSQAPTVQPVTTTPADMRKDVIRFVSDLVKETSEKLPDGFTDWSPAPQEIRLLMEDYAVTANGTAQSLDHVLAHRAKHTSDGGSPVNQPTNRRAVA